MRREARTHTYTVYVPSDVRHYNRTMFHEFHVLNKVSKIGYDRKYIRCKIFASIITSQKAVMQAVSIIDYPVEPHLLVLVKVKKILAKRLSHACVETHIKSCR